MQKRRRLVLTRALGESLEIGDNVTITIHQLRGNGKVRLTIEAPDSVKVLRSELTMKESGDE
jgi:carbon storage regulator